MKHTTRNLRRLKARLSAVRVRRAERTREEILRAGLKIFADKGFRAATMDDIALELDATKGLLYYHFKTKDEILRAILADNRLIGGIEGIFDVLGTMPLRAALETAARGALELMEANKELVRFLQVQALLSGAEAEVVYTEVLDRLVEGAARVIEHFKGTGEVRAEVDGREFARLMVDAVISCFIQGQLFGQRHPRGANYLKQMVETFYSGIAAAPAAAPSDPKI